MTNNPDCGIIITERNKNTTKEEKEMTIREVIERLEQLALESKDGENTIVNYDTDDSWGMGLEVTKIEFSESGFLLIS